MPFVAIKTCKHRTPLSIEIRSQKIKEILKNALRSWVPSFKEIVQHLQKTGEKTDPKTLCRHTKKSLKRNRGAETISKLRQPKDKIQKINTLTKNH